jgi:hypothetical protein
MAPPISVLSSIPERKERWCLSSLAVAFCDVPIILIRKGRYLGRHVMQERWSIALAFCDLPIGLNRKARWWGVNRRERFVQVSIAPCLLLGSGLYSGRCDGRSAGLRKEQPWSVLEALLRIWILEPLRVAFKRASYQAFSSVQIHGTVEHGQPGPMAIDVRWNAKKGPNPGGESGDWTISLLSAL